MNAKEIQSLTSKLAANPNFLREMEETALRDFLLAYTTGLLEPEIEQEARELIASDPIAGTIWKEFTDIDARLHSLEGQHWVNESSERILSNALKAVARDEQLATTSSTPPDTASWELIKTTRDWLEAKFALFTNLPEVEFGAATNEVFCGDNADESQNQRVLTLTHWYTEDALLEKLPWASHIVILQKVPIKRKPGVVRYRALVEKRGAAGANSGILRIALRSGEQIDEITLQADMPSKTFQNAALASDAPVAFKPLLG